MPPLEVGWLMFDVTTSSRDPDRRKLGVARGKSATLWASKYWTALYHPGDRQGPGQNEIALAETKTPWRPHIATFDS